ncbi:MAG: hypothetical protein IPO92_03695 [Saprospiraceae bacterium]|nr:hypothetical protein [Saprospiraceae bacterium]
MINEPIISTKNSLKLIDFKKNPIHIWTKKRNKISKITLPEILIISSYPPRECGIATYTQDLIKALNNKYNHSFNISVCPIESTFEQHIYTDKMRYVLNVDNPKIPKTGA